MPGYAASWEDDKKTNSDNYVKSIIDYLTNRYIENINPVLLDDSIIILTKLPKTIDFRESVIHMSISKVSIQPMQENSYGYIQNVRDIYTKEELINVTIHSIDPIISKEYNKCYFEKNITISDESKVYNKDKELITYISAIKMKLHFRFISDLTRERIMRMDNFAFNNLTKYIL